MTVIGADAPPLSVTLLETVPGVVPTVAVTLKDALSLGARGVARVQVLVSALHVQPSPLRFVIVSPDDGWSVTIIGAFAATVEVFLTVTV